MLELMQQDFNIYAVDGQGPAVHFVHESLIVINHCDVHLGHLQL